MTAPVQCRVIPASVCRETSGQPYCFAKIIRHLWHCCILQLIVRPAIFQYNFEVHLLPWAHYPPLCILVYSCRCQAYASSVFLVNSVSVLLILISSMLRLMIKTSSSSLI